MSLGAILDVPMEVEEIPSWRLPERDLSGLRSEPVQHPPPVNTGSIPVPGVEQQQVQNTSVPAIQPVMPVPRTVGSDQAPAATSHPPPGAATAPPIGFIPYARGGKPREPHYSHRPKPVINGSTVLPASTSASPQPVQLPPSRPTLPPQPQLAPLASTVPIFTPPPLQAHPVAKPPPIVNAAPPKKPKKQVPQQDPRDQLIPPEQLVNLQSQNLKQDEKTNAQSAAASAIVAAAVGATFAPASDAKTVEIPKAVVETKDQPVTILQEAEVDEEETTLKPAKRERKERIRRIHLPELNKETDELSDHEFEGEWEEAKEGVVYPPGYTGRRRIKSTVPKGQIKPDYYYPTEGSSRGVPVFEPTYEEYRDFNSFIKKIDNYGMRSGIVKIVPPKEWHDSLVSVSEPLKDTRIKEPIEQHFMGSKGLFRQSNIGSRRGYNVKQWKEMCDSEKYRTPNFFGAPEEKKSKKESAAANKRARRSSTKANSRKAGDVKEETPAPEDVQTEQAASPASAVAVPTSPAMSAASMTHSESSMTSQSAPGTPVSTPAGFDLSPSVPGQLPTSNKKRTRAEEAQEDFDKEWETFDWTTLPWGAKSSDFTVEECKKIERQYWRTFTFGDPPMYGADGSGSLFDDSTKDWNVANLDDLLMRINPHMPMPGVNTPYLYFGMWRATFAWHVEDADLYSINYIHFGAPKFWYSVPQLEAERFERVMGGYFQKDQSKCPEFMRHKSFLVSPTTLAKDGVPLNRVIQFPGETIITYPYGYHSGFNLGFNCAESINFATEQWLDIGRRARPCLCQPDTVRINVDTWLEEARTDAEKMRADPAYAEQRKREREELAAIPQHIARKRREAGLLAIEQGKPRTTAPLRQPKVETPESKAQKAKKEKKEKKVKSGKAATAASAAPPAASTQAVLPSPAGAPANNLYTSDFQSVAIQAVKSTPQQYVCALCPEMNPDGLVRVHGTGSKKTRPLYAHKICVTFTPTTWCATDAVNGEEVVMGFQGIEKERWNLKCGLCTDKHGTKIQCTKSTKCVRAFHATCALRDNSGVVLDVVLGGRSVLEPAAQDGGQDSCGTLQLVVACRQHNPAWQRQIADKKREELAARVATLQEYSTITIKSSNGGIFDVLVLNKAHGPETLLVQFADGKTNTCKHSSIIWDDEKAKKAKNGQNPSGPQQGSYVAAHQYVTPPRVHPIERSRLHQSSSSASATPQPQLHPPQQLQPQSAQAFPQQHPQQYAQPRPGYSGQQPVNALFPFANAQGLQGQQQQPNSLNGQFKQNDPHHAMSQPSSYAQPQQQQHHYPMAPPIYHSAKPGQTASFGSPIGAAPLPTPSYNQMLPLPAPQQQGYHHDYRHQQQQHHQQHQQQQHNQVRNYSQAQMPAPERPMQFSSAFGNYDG